MTPTLPFPALLTTPDGATVGPARVAVQNGELRAWTVVSGRIHLALRVPIGEAEVLAPTRSQREWTVETEQGTYALRRGGCP